MCGIAGIALLDNGRSIQPEWIALMCDRLAHRGPDDSGIHIDGNIALGSRRLAIQDTSQAGHMPMVSPDGKVVISLNGEIYKFREIRKDLEKSSDSRFRSNTDTEYERRVALCVVVQRR